MTSVAQQHCTSHSGYGFELHSRRWQISKDNHLYLSWVDEFLDSEIRHSFLQIIKYYTENYSAGHANNLSDRFREFARYVFNARGLIKTLTTHDLINYRSTLDREHEWYLGSIRGLLKKWFEFGYSGLEEGIPDLLENWRLKGNIKGRAVQTLCPKDGPLSDLEFEALHQGLVDAFEQDLINVEDLTLVQSFIATGRRPSQIADLKIKDLVVARSADGLEEFILNVPRRKQRGDIWRRQFKPFALNREIGILIQSLIAQNKIRLSNIIKNIKPSVIVEFPIFPRWTSIEAIVKAEHVNQIELAVLTPEFHRPTMI